MKIGFIQAGNGEFRVDNRKIILRGFAIGSWMNIESFMLRIPGSEKRIRQAFAEVYGPKNSDAFFNDFLNCFIAEEDFELLKSLGVNVIRLALGHRHFVDDQKSGVYKQEGFKHLDRVLMLCRKYGIYAILDMHSSPGGQNPDSHGGGDSGMCEFWENASLRERIINLWGVIAEKYKNDSIIAGYDILNEPSFVPDADTFNDFYDKVIEEVRRADTNHVLFLEGDDWAKDFSIFRKLGGPQQAISFHFYPGQHVFMYDSPELRIAQLEKKISYFTNLREKTGMPLWVGETGGHFPGDKLLEGLELVKECIDIFEKHGISWTIWSYKDAGAMGMVYPREDTKWMAMAAEFRRQWQVKGRSNPSIANEVFALLEDRFSFAIGDNLKELLKFRIFALLNELHVHKILIPKLRTIPWDEMKEYPKSFLLENCEGCDELAELVKSYTNAASFKNASS